MTKKDSGAFDLNRKEGACAYIQYCAFGSRLKQFRESTIRMSLNTFAQNYA
jgi:hypothetical protein